MTATETPEYKKLALDSSNEMMDHDGDRGLGRYASAALHIQRAGAGRRRMGQIMFEAGDFVQAAADWLSASACFLLAAQPERVKSGIDAVRRLNTAGRIPDERRDLHAALAEREEELTLLEEKLNRFVAEYRHRAGLQQSSPRELLDFLRKQVREFPGFARLHYAIYLRARELGQALLAAEHLRWAAEFDAENPGFVGRFGYHLISSGQPDQAAEIARRFLQAHPDEKTIHVLLAHALMSAAGGQSPDYERAIALLHPLTKDTSAEVGVRLAAVVLSAAYHYDLGHEAEYRRLLATFDHLAGMVQKSEARGMVEALRQLLPPTRTAGVNGSPHAGSLSISEEDRARLFQTAEQLNLPSLVEVA